MVSPYILLQFQDESATKLVKKKGSKVMFLLHAALPMTLSSATILIYSYHMDVMMGFDIIAHFSPLTNWDVFIVYTFQTASVMMPFILCKSYKKMETTLSEFCQLYNQSMHGIMTKGRSFYLQYDLSLKIIMFRRN